MNRVVRLAPLGQKPQSIILLDGKSTENKQHPAKTAQSPVVIDGVRSIMAALSPNTKFDYKLHIEFRTVYAEERGQGRETAALSHGRYEIRVLDSYGLQGLDNECGGIYKSLGPV